MALILVVDDSPLVLEMVRDLLEENGHEIRVAQKALEAVLMTKIDRYDLILMDLNLPDIRGESAIRVLRGNHQVKAPIIVLSGAITKDVIASLVRWNVSGYVAKTDDFEERLLEEVGKALGL